MKGNISRSVTKRVQVHNEIAHDPHCLARLGARVRPLDTP